MQINFSKASLLVASRSLDDQRQEFSRRRMLAMPLAGTLAWACVGASGALLTPRSAAIVLFVATGLIVYLGMFLSRFTGENFTDRSKPKNAFDSLFFLIVAMSVLVYAIAIPFFMLDYTSLPLTVGILSGLMWIPLSWIIQHWIGLFHGIIRTLAVVTLWHLFPAHRFVAIPIIIVAIYLVTMTVLEIRWRNLPP
jgi:hypothetical protein